MVTVMNSRNCLRLLHLDDVGAFVKKDKIIFMIDSRTFNSLRGKRQNNQGTKNCMCSNEALSPHVSPIPENL